MKMNLQLKDKITLTGGIAKAAALFSLVVCVMLIANYLQLKSVDPLESPALNSLVERLHDNPNDELLKQDIRALDLLIRKAYFTSQWQIRTGAYLLIFGMLILILAIRYLKSLRPGLEELESIEKNAFLDKQQARKWLIFAGGSLFVVALISGFYSNNILDQYESKALIEDQKTSGVEIIKVLPIADAVDKPALEQEAVTASANVEIETHQPEEIVDEPVVIVEETKVEEAVVETVKPTVENPTREQLRMNYPFFRGAEGTGVSYQSNVPDKWDISSGENILWKVKLKKHGYNSPIVWGHQLFISGADAEARVVYCYNKDTGELLWESKADKIPGSPDKIPKVTEDTGLAASTMATNGYAVFAIFGTGDLIAFNMNGERLWAKNLGVPDNHYGHSSSLIIYHDKLIIQYDTNRGAKLIALDTNDGSLKWETQRDVNISWASPVMVDVNGHDELILAAEPLVAGYDPETGNELWRVDCLMGEVGPSVGYDNGIVYAANEYATLAAIKLGDNPEIIWEDNEYLPEVASPLAVDGLLIIATSYGVLVCYDANDGTKYWEQEYNDGIYASPVYTDGKVYVMDMGGNMHVIKWDKEYHLIAESALGEKSVCSPVFVDGKMYLRGFEHLYCIGK